MKILRFSFIKFLFLLFVSCSITSCIKWDPKSTREFPTDSQARAKKNVEEGRGISVGGLLKGGGGTNFEFSTSNPMWRASLEVIDFLPLTTVDYSGGLIITDWYNDNSNNSTQLKITIRFLSNEVSPNNLKIIIHKKICEKVNNLNCSIKTDSSSKIKEELVKAIITLASRLEKENLKKK